MRKQVKHCFDDDGQSRHDEHEAQVHARSAFRVKSAGEINLRDTKQLEPQLTLDCGTRSKDKGEKSCTNFCSRRTKLSVMAKELVSLKRQKTIALLITSNELLACSCETSVTPPQE
jgi:hypothetical protein